MKIVTNEYCNECKTDTYLEVIGVDEDSIFAKCPLCGAKFDLINDGRKRINDVEVAQ